MSTGDETAFLNPPCSTVTTQRPMWRGLATYSPDSLVVVVKLWPRSRSVTVTVAPATTAPLGSRTRPTMAPVSFCAQAAVTDNRNRRARQVRVRKFGMAMRMTKLLGPDPLNIRRGLATPDFRARVVRLLGSGV